MVGINVVIEGDQVPAVSRMAGIADIAEVSVVVVVFQVARHTCSVHRVAKRIVTVAIVTGQLAVLSQ